MVAAYSIRKRLHCILPVDSSAFNTIKSLNNMRGELHVGHGLASVLAGLCLTTILRGKGRGDNDRAGLANRITRFSPHSGFRTHTRLSACYLHAPSIHKVPTYRPRIHCVRS